MFKLQPNPTFKAKVGLSVAGAAKPVEIEVEFRYLKKSEVKAFFDNLDGKNDAEALTEILIGWSGIDQPYTADALALLLDNYPASARDLFGAFSRELLEARTKN